jgi:hypothetical protein
VVTLSLQQSSQGRLLLKENVAGKSDISLDNDRNPQPFAGALNATGKP